MHLQDGLGGCGEGRDRSRTRLSPGFHPGCLDQDRERTPEWRKPPSHREPPRWQEWLKKHREYRLATLKSGEHGLKLVMADDSH
jgi:hypothetical protein